MIPAVLHHTQALRAVGAAQIAFAALAIGAFAIVALSPSGAERPVPPIVLAAPPAPKPPAQGPTTNAPLADARGISAMFSQLGNSPKPPEKPKDPEVPAAVEPKVSEESVRFLGSLSEPNRRLALLKIGDHQRLVSPGEKIEAMTLLEVGVDFAVVQDEHGKRRLEKGERQGPSVTYVSGNPGNPSAGSLPTSRINLNTFNPGPANAAVENSVRRLRGNHGTPSEKISDAVEAIGDRKP